MPSQRVAFAQTTKTDIAQLLQAGTVSLSSDGEFHIVTITFSERDDAERLFNSLTGES